MVDDLEPNVDRPSELETTQVDYLISVHSSSE